MSIITSQITTSPLFQNEFFTLAITHRVKATKIDMKMLTSFFTTQTLPSTYSILKSELPSIMYSKCFNENNYKFSKEVKNTEIGHLLEHILLEYLSQIKTAHGVNNPIHNGFTRWNWTKEEKGFFHIEIDSGVNDQELFIFALSKSVILLETILTSRSLPISPDFSTQPSQLLQLVVGNDL